MHWCKSITCNVSIAASLPRCLAASLPRCLAASVSRCLAASLHLLPRCIASSFRVSQFRPVLPALLLPRSLLFSSPLPTQLHSPHPRRDAAPSLSPFTCLPFTLPPYNFLHLPCPPALPPPPQLSSPTSLVPSPCSAPHPSRPSLPVRPPTVIRGRVRADGFLSDLRAAWGGNFIEARTWAYDARCLQGLDDGSDDIPVLKGLICSADGSIIEINLQHRSLVGVIPEFIKYFTALTGLYLSDNELYGSIPAGISALASLQYLHLDYNSISGTLPSTIGKLPLLQSLRLKANLLTGTIPNMATLKNLATLDLSLNRLNGSIPPTLAAMPGVGELFLAGNSLSGPLPPKLNMPNLYSLDLSFNFLSGSIPVTISTLASLQYMDLGYNQLSGSLPSQMVKLTGLQRLDLLANAMTGSIPLIFSSLSALQTLVLQRNSMSGPIPPQLSVLTGLSELSLSSNVFQGSLPASFSALTSLTWLDVRSNMLVGEVDVLANGTAWYDHNYLSSTVFDASSCDADTPLSVSFRRNCIPPTVCDAMPQRTDAECAAFCGLKPADGEVCGGQGTCALLPQQAVQAGVCTCGDSLQNGEDPATCVSSSAPPVALSTTLLSSSLPAATVSGAATVSATTGAITLTTLALNEWGAALLTAPTRLFSYGLRKSGCGRPFAFSASFAFQSTPEAGKKSAGGVAFVIAATDTAATGDVTGLGYSGLGQRSVAVEFDGFQDKALTIKDMSANHVGVNLNGNPMSVAAITSPLVAGDGKVKFAWIDYVPLSDAAGTLSVFVAATAVKPAKAVLSAALSLCSVLAPVEGDESFHVGFTGASSALVGQRNVILNYSLSTSLPSALSPKPTVAYPTGFAFTKDAFSSLNANRFSRHVSVAATTTPSPVLAWSPKPDVNWNNTGLLWPIKDQLKCADSWAFALVSSIEAAYSIVGNLSRSTVFNVDPLRTSLKSNCKGGSPVSGLQFLVTSGKTGGGLTAKATYTRPLGSASLKRGKPAVPTFPIAGWERTPGMGWFGLLLAVQQQPVVVTIQATAPSFISYNGLLFAALLTDLGVPCLAISLPFPLPLLPLLSIAPITNPSVSLSPPTTSSFSFVSPIHSPPHFFPQQPPFSLYLLPHPRRDPACFTFAPNHAVLVVGYRLSGTDPALPHIAAPYWIIRNSWGDGWGDGGHMRMDMQGGYGVCGINTLPGPRISAAPSRPCQHNTPLRPCLSTRPSPSLCLLTLTLPCSLSLPAHLLPLPSHPLTSPTPLPHAASSDACNSDIVQADGTLLANPCGGFACTVVGTSNTCDCDGTVYVQATNLDGSRTCTLVDVCGAAGFNPCAVGTCVNDGAGSYSCVCPRGFIQGTTVDGAFSCAPALTVATSYVVRGGGVTCAHVHQTVGLTLQQLKTLNPALSCNVPIPVNTTVTTTSTSSLSPCSTYYTTAAGDTCVSIASRHSLTDTCEPVQGEACTSPSTTACVTPCKTALQALNPGLDCSTDTDGTLPAYLSVCVKVDYLYVPRVPACPHVHTVAPGETCDVLRKTVAGGMSVEELYQLNPGILCDRIALHVPAAAAVIPNYDVCWADVYDPQIPTCPRPYVILKADTCDTILPKSFGGSHDCFRQINGYECLNPVQVGARICLPDPAALLRGRCLV
ncbi:unnamed protein product [Closterium sp. NIES-53]